MKKLILAAALPALALAGAAQADHHQAGEHAGHGQHGEHAQHTVEMFMKHHGEALSGAINHPTRAEDRARDQYRHPAETLAFFHVAPHMKVAEYAPGGGWYSRLLGHYLGGEGQLVGVYANPVSASSDPARQQAVRDSAAKFPAEVEGWTGLPAERFKGMTLENIPEDQIGTFDRVLMIRALHGILRDNIADSEIRALRSLLKDGGMLGVVQHRTRPDAAFGYTSGNRGYLREADVIALMQVHGFELVDKSEVNANPQDTADYPQGVWEMPPSLRTKRADLADRGESDRMTLLFKKRP